MTSNMNDIVQTTVTQAIDPNIAFIAAIVFGYCLYRFITMTNKNSSDDLDEMDAEIDVQRDDAVFLDSGEFDKYEYDYFKLVLVIRTDLKMGKGKVAAQCSHAAVAAYKAARRVSSKVVKIWEKCGQAKITLKVDSEAELIKIAKQAKDIGLISNIVQDAGHTQIPAGSKTVCAIGPGPAKLIDQFLNYHRCCD